MCEASTADFLFIRANILPAETCALEASGAKEVALPRERAVNTTAPNTLGRGRFDKWAQVFQPFLNLLEDVIV